MLSNSKVLFFEGVSLQKTAKFCQIILSHKHLFTLRVLTLYIQPFKSAVFGSC